MSGSTITPDATLDQINPNDSTGSISGSIDNMRDAFDAAISAAAEVTTVTTEKKAELDAAKQRPNA
ncbi:MAG TPA: hypothetical protein VFO41_15115 [Alphaproteobacteria bacterium]|nr:hypothetical protein [Alphaproteobacteria bacterium]